MNIAAVLAACLGAASMLCATNDDAGGENIAFKAGRNMRPDLFTISRGGRGRLSTMTRPRGGDWLTDELDDLAMAGVSVMVSLLSDAEAAELDLIHEADAAQAAGIEFHRLPTPDRQVPDREATLALGRLLLQRLSDGASVALHCREGIGRSSTLAAAVLVLEGTAAADAWGPCVRCARPSRTGHGRTTRIHQHAGHEVGPHLRHPDSGMTVRSPA